MCGNGARGRAIRATCESSVSMERDDTRGGVLCVRSSAWRCTQRLEITESAAM